MAGTKNGVVPAVLACLIEHQGETVTVEYLAGQTGLEPQQIKTGMYRLVRDEKWPVDTIQKGHLWKVGRSASDTSDTPTDPNVATFDVVERMGDALVLAAPDGNLWLAKRIGKVDR